MSHAGRVGRRRRLPSSMRAAMRWDRTGREQEEGSRCMGNGIREIETKLVQAAAMRSQPKWQPPFIRSKTYRNEVPVAQDEESRPEVTKTLSQQ